MITSKEAFVAVQLVPDPPLQPLTEAEEIQLDALDAAVESGILRTFNGRIFDMAIPAAYVTPSVIAALRSRYEAPEAGWTTGVFVSQADEEGDPVEIRLVFAPTVSRVEVPAKADVVYVTAVGGEQAPRVLVRVFAQGPPYATLDAVAAVRTKAGMPVAVEVLVDREDANALASANLRRLVDLDCVVTVGDFKTRGTALAGGRVEDWDALIVFGVDMVPIVDGFAARAYGALRERFSHLDGAVFFDDGVSREERCAMPVLGRRLVDQIEYVYAPGYRDAPYADKELTEVLRSRGRLAYVPEMIVENRAPAWDAESLEHDRWTFEARIAQRRLHARTGFDAPPIYFSIGIAARPAQKGIDRLVDEVYRQARACGDSGAVEVLVDDRAAPITVGEKRQAILDRARGRFVTFVDGGDWIAHDYVRRIVAAIWASPDVDCVGLRGAMTVFDRVEVFDASLRSAVIGEIAQDGVRLRAPHHRTPIRREIALHAGFPAVNFGEDLAYAERVRPHLRTEVHAGDGVLYHCWYDPANEAK